MAIRAQQTCALVRARKISSPIDNAVQHLVSNILSNEQNNRSVLISARGKLTTDKTHGSREFDLARQSP